MRLCRQDSNEVRTISARALYNFSCDPDTVEPLRRHHILSFIQVCNVYVQMFAVNETTNANALKLRLNLSTSRYS